MAHYSQNPLLYAYYDDPEGENEISSIALQLAAASAAAAGHRQGGATQPQSYPGQPSSTHHPHHHPPPTPTHNSHHPAMLSAIVSTPGLPAGFYHHPAPPSLNSDLASAIVAAEYQRQRAAEASSAAQFAAARMNGMQPYILGFSNYGNHTPAPAPTAHLPAYHQPPHQHQHQHQQHLADLGAYSGIGAMVVGGMSPLSPESSSHSNVAHSATSVVHASSPPAAPSFTRTAIPVTAPLLSTTAVVAASEPIADAAAAAVGGTTVTVSDPSTTNNAKGDKSRSTPPPRVRRSRPELPTPEWFSASIPLGVDEDKYYLSELQCVLRSEFVEVFGTAKSDTVLFINGRNKTIVIGQVGIRCKHCASISSNTTTTISDCNHPNLAQHAVSYPSCIGGIYNIVQQMYRLHFEQCPYVPDELKARVANLSKHTYNRGGRKSYWTESAKRIGLMDTLFGIHFGRDPKEPPPPLVIGGGRGIKNMENVGENDIYDDERSHDETNETLVLEPGDISRFSSRGPAPTPADDVELYPLVTEDEKHLVADYLFLALEQMQPCNLMDSDRVGCYKGRRTGFPGLACKYCVGQAGCGRYFPASEASLSQTTTSQTIINHVRNCRRCPLEVRKQLEKMRRAKHCADKKTDKPKHGGRKVFFRRLWCRIQRIPLPTPGTIGSDDKEKETSASSPDNDGKQSEILEKKKRKISAISCEKDNSRKSAKRPLEHRKADHAHDDPPHDTLEHDSKHEGGNATFTPDRAAKTASIIRSNSKTRSAYQGRTPLARGDDSCWLSEADCFLRQEIVEVFTAQEEDLKLNGDAEIGQVGVRCFYCAENKSAEDRDKGYACYPSVVATIQQSVSDLNSRHIRDCSEIPDDLRMSLQSMKTHEEKNLGDTAQYWIDAAKELGLHDSHEGHGIFFFRNPLEDSPADEIDIEKNDNESSGSVLVPKEDRAKSTDHILLLLKQFEPCQFNESDRKSSRNRDRTLNYPGLGCIHCKVKRYFPLTEKKLQDSLSLMTTHIENCFHAPLEVKASLCYLQHRSLMQKQKLAGQWKFAFLKGVWNRLHQNYKMKDSVADSDTEAAGINSSHSVKGAVGKGRSTLWRREKAAILPKKQEPAEEEVDSIVNACQESLIGNNTNDNSNNNDDQERRQSLAEMGHLIKAAALWLSERDAENDARALGGGGKSKGIKKK